MTITAAVSAHEAGHAICGLSVGRMITEITLDPGDGNLGLTTYDASVKHSRNAALHDLHVAVSLVGGEMGERLADIPGIECPTAEREKAQRRCVLIAPTLGVNPARLYFFVEQIARRALHINRVQFDSLRWWLERERQITGDQIALITAGLRRVDLLTKFGIFKREPKPMRELRKY